MYNEDDHRAAAPPLPPGGLVKPSEPLMERDWFFFLVLIGGLAIFFGVGTWLFEVL